MNEEWIKYENQNLPKGTYEVLEIIQNNEGLFIKLDNEQNIYSIYFHIGFISYRVCDEGDRLQTIANIFERNSNDFFVGWPLYLVNNSDFSKWIESETFNIKTVDTYKHFAIVTPNDIIDVLTYIDPEVYLSDGDFS